jgi:tRNA(adenine34) deaminase
MCAAAISFARIRRLYYGAPDPKGGAVEQRRALSIAQPTCHHAPEVYSEGMRAQTEAADDAQDVFQGASLKRQ